MTLLTTLKIFLAYAVASVSVGVLVGAALMLLGLYRGWL